MGSPKKTLEQYKQQAAAIHGGLFSYELWTELGKYHDKIPVLCRIHGVFYPSLANHIARKSGCPACRAEARAAGDFRRLPIDSWVKRANAIHNNAYEYVGVDHIRNTSTDKALIRCQQHGTFEQTFADHVQKKAGCPQCARGNRVRTNMRKYGCIHPSQQHLSSAVMAKLNDRDWMSHQHHALQRTLEHIALELGVQDTTVGGYMRQHDIEVKRFAVSTGEREIAEWCSSLTNIATSDRSVISPRELDVYVPSHKIAIEYCGLYWHGDKFKHAKYHQSKFQQCADAGVRLITLFEDEWRNSKHIVQSKIHQLLGASVNPTVYARKCAVRDSSEHKAEFFKANHIQGDGPSSINLGLYHGDDLVACIGFISKQHGVYTLNRYATACNVPGGFTKLLKAFIRTHEWQTIETFADLRWSVGDLYVNNGFEQVSTLAPDYYWTDGVTRWHKFGFRHKHLARKFSNYDSTQTEDWNCRNNGLWKIYDCGKMKYQLHNTDKDRT